jgi:hypothetical protein
MTNVVVLLTITYIDFSFIFGDQGNEHLAYWKEQG